MFLPTRCYRTHRKSTLICLMCLVVTAAGIWVHVQLPAGAKGNPKSWGFIIRAPRPRPAMHGDPSNGPKVWNNGPNQASDDLWGQLDPIQCLTSLNKWLTSCFLLYISWLFLIYWGQLEKPKIHDMFSMSLSGRDSDQDSNAEASVSSLLITTKTLLRGG